MSDTKFPKNFAWHHTHLLLASRPSVRSLPGFRSTDPAVPGPEEPTSGKPGGNGLDHRPTLSAALRICNPVLSHIHRLDCRQWFGGLRIDLDLEYS